MNDRSERDAALSAAMYVDDLCSRFEAAWQCDAKPDLQQYLRDVPGERRPTALAELVALEVQYRRRLGETPEIAEYHAQFPDCPEAIARGFGLALDGAAATLDRTVARDPAAPWAFKVRCPHCQSRVEVIDAHGLEKITCSSCGSSFGLVGDEGLLYETEDGQLRRRQRIAHFELLELLGNGAFGGVWKARDTKLDRVVAVKIPRKGCLDRDETEKFLRDARAAAQLCHPNIVAVHEVGVEGDLVYIVSDLIDGISLDDYLAGRRFSMRESAQLCAKIALALEHAHEAGVIHRDLKPSNIMLDARSEPHLIDFGLAKREAADVSVTIEGQVLGTPAFMPPEQAKGAGHLADRRSDVYSLGVILYLLLTGERPFRGSVRMILAQVIEDDPPRPRKLNGHVPRDLETICLRCMAKEPARRFAAARDVAEELERFLRNEPIHSRPVSWWERMSRWCKRKPLVATLSATTALCLAAIVIGSPIWAVRERAAAQESLLREQESLARQAADERANRNLAESHLRASQLAGRRGDWRDALKELDAVEQIGTVPLALVGLERVQAWDALNELAPWAAEIDKLENAPGIEEHRGQVLFWKSMRLRSQGDEKAADECLREALRAGLPPADDAYARALVAQTSPEALRLFETALQYDPVHHNAMVQYVGLLLFSGQTARAKDLANAGKVLFPQDPSFPLALAVVAASGRRPQDAETLLEECVGKFDEPTIRQMRTVVNTWKTFSEVNPFQVSLLQIGRALASLFSSLNERGSGQGTGSGSQQGQRITPLFEIPVTARQAYGKVVQALIPSVKELLKNAIPGLSGSRLTDDRTVQQLQEAVRMHPEGTLYLILGMAFFDLDRAKEAEDAFAAAAETPAVLPQVRHAALILAGGEALAQYVAAGRKAEDLQRAVDYWRKYIDEGVVAPEQVNWLLQPLIKVKQTELLRLMIDKSLAKYPDRIDLLRARAEVEWAAGAYGSAWDAAAKVLEREPNNEAALKISTEAATQLRTKLEPSSPPEK